LLLPVLYRASRLLVFLALVLPESEELDVRCSRSLLKVGTDSAFLSLWLLRRAFTFGWFMGALWVYMYFKVCLSRLPSGRVLTMKIDDWEVQMHIGQPVSFVLSNVVPFNELHLDLFLLCLTAKWTAQNNVTGGRTTMIVDHCYTLPHSSPTPQDSFSLLAYTDPKSSPVGYLLNPIQREPVCAALNSAILGGVY